MLHRKYIKKKLIGWKTTNLVQLLFIWLIFKKKKTKKQLSVKLGHQWFAQQPFVTIFIIANVKHTSFEPIIFSHKGKQFETVISMHSKTYNP